MNRLLKILVIIGVVAGACLSQGGTVSAANNPFTCSANFYQVFSSQLKLLDPLTGAYTNIGSNAAFDYNAIGYNALDNYLYGILHSGPQTGNLVRISNDGTITDMGLPTGLPVAGYLNGSFDLAGNLYIRSDVHTIYKINVLAMTAVPLTISGDAIVAGTDNVFINNKLYLMVNSNLSVVDLNTNSAATVTVSGPAGWLNAGGGFGAGWTDQAGELFFSNNDSGSIYQILNFGSNAPTASFKVAGTVTSNNDGASCPLAAQNPFDPPAPTNDSYTTTFNTPLNEIITPILNNDAGTSLTVTSNTTPAHGTVSVNSDGTFLYTPNSGFSGTDSFDYTVTDSFGRTASATVTITIASAAVSTSSLSSPSSVQPPDTGFGVPPSINPLATFGIYSSVALSLAMFSFISRKIFSKSSA